MSSNSTEADMAWDAIEPGHGVVALDRTYAKAQGLLESSYHPREKYKVVYLIEAYHAMHCLVRPPLPSHHHPVPQSNSKRKVSELANHSLRHTEDHPRALHNIVLLKSLPPKYTLLLQLPKTKQREGQRRLELGRPTRYALPRHPTSTHHVCG